MPAGRHLNGVWYYFCRSAEGERLNVKATCRGCGTVMCGIVSRMWRHVESCPQLIDECGLYTPPPPTSTDDTSSQATLSSTSSEGSRKRAYQALLEPIRTNTQVKEALDGQLARFFLAAAQGLLPGSDPRSTP